MLIDNCIDHIGRYILTGRRVYRHSIPELRMGFPSAKNWFYCKSSHKFTVINTILIQERRRSSSRVQTIAYCLRKFSSIYIIVRMGNYQLSSFFKYLIIMTQRSKIIHFIDFSEKSEEIQIDPCSESQTHSQHYTDIKPTLDSGIWFGKSIREIENTLRPVNIYRPMSQHQPFFSDCRAFIG